MSYHVLHITTPNSYLSVDRGLLFCKFQNNELKMIAPTPGTITAFYITDRQWTLSVNIQKVNYKSSKYKKNAGENIEKQMTFW